MTRPALRCLLIALLWLGTLTASAPAAAACTSGACVTTGARPATVDQQRANMLNALLGRLANTTLSLSQSDWNTIATTDLRMLRTFNALQTTLGTQNTTATLAYGISLSQLFTAAATAATLDNHGALSSSLSALATQVGGASATIQLNAMITTDGVIGTTTMNALDLVSGAIELYNKTRVTSTSPTSVTLTGADVGLASTVNSVQMWAQAVESPLFVCGQNSASFRTGGIRLKYSIELVPVNPSTGLLVVLGVSATIQINHLDLYAEVASAPGAIGTINAATNALTAQATPGVAKMFIGSILNTNFFDRSHALVAADVDYSGIGNATIAGTPVSVRAKSNAIGGASSAQALSFSAAGGYPQTQTATHSNTNSSSLTSTLMSNLTVDTQPALGLGLVLTPLVNTALASTVQTALTTLMPGLVSSLVDSMLGGTVGVRISSVDVNSGGKYTLCGITGCVYEDANHSLRQDGTELGTGTTLYAKLLDAELPAGPAVAVATVDPTTGQFAFTGRGSGNYLLVINTTSALANITPTAPSGWIPTEMPSLSRNLTMLKVDVPNQNLGLFHGSKLSGTVFKDNGAGGGTANNGTRDGTEAAIVTSSVKATDSTGATLYDSASSGDSGAYTLWLPFTTNGAALKVTQSGSSDWFPIAGSAGTTGGSYTRATDTVAFTHASGSSYTGVNFADVPVSKLDTDGQQIALAGSVAFFPHSFTAGSAGQLSFVLSAPATTGWSATAYVDTNCNGAIDSGETLASAAISVVADQKVCIVLRVFTPETAPYNTQYPVALTAQLAYANSSVTSSHARNDLVTIGNGSDSGLRLTKTVDKATASPGETITYTLTYLNQSTAVLSAIKLMDSTPAYTTFVSSACGAVPNASITCSASTKPAVGLTGHIEWTFTGSLTSGASGTVSFSVLVQ